MKPYEIASIQSLIGSDLSEYLKNDKNLQLVLEDRHQHQYNKPCYTKKKSSYSEQYEQKSKYDSEYDSCDSSEECDSAEYEYPNSSKKHNKKNMKEYAKKAKKHHGEKYDSYGEWEEENQGEEYENHKQKAKGKKHHKKYDSEYDKKEYDNYETYDEHGKVKKNTKKGKHSKSGKPKYLHDKPVEYDHHKYSKPEKKENDKYPEPSYPPKQYNSSYPEHDKYIHSKQYDYHDKYEPKPYIPKPSSSKYPTPPAKPHYPLTSVNDAGDNEVVDVSTSDENVHNNHGQTRIRSPKEIAENDNNNVVNDNSVSIEIDSQGNVASTGNWKSV